jgi:peptidyl-prolyl cis-trans isomerase-like 3
MHTALEGRVLIQCACRRVIDGADSTLDAIEKVPVDDKYRPRQEIRLKSVTIHANPIADRDL